MFFQRYLLLAILKSSHSLRYLRVSQILLGFECQSILRDCLGKYDYYCFLEDDLIIHDPWFFIKLNWFTQHLGNLNLLQPNRYEISYKGLVNKAYIDGNLASRVTAPFQNVQDKSTIEGKIMDVPITFSRALKPHAGCYFLNAHQMDYWVKQPYFLDRDTSFISPLESAATLGIMKTFRVYKTASEQASFLEIQHKGSGIFKFNWSASRLDGHPAKFFYPKKNLAGNP